jgi:hypothetical protein
MKTGIAEDFLQALTVREKRISRLIQASPAAAARGGRRMHAQTGQLFYVSNF